MDDELRRNEILTGVIEKALLSKTIDYETVRDKIIKEYGQELFSQLQKIAFNKIFDRKAIAKKKETA